MSRHYDSTFLLENTDNNNWCIKTSVRTSLLVQWLRICLPMQGTQVQALVWEDSACRGATKPMHHNYWSRRTQSPCSATREATMRSPCNATKTQCSHKERKKEKDISDMGKQAGKKITHTHTHTHREREITYILLIPRQNNETKGK